MKIPFNPGCTFDSSHPVQDKRKRNSAKLLPFVILIKDLPLLFTKTGLQFR